jgi:hypothetical protein
MLIQTITPASRLAAHRWHPAGSVMALAILPLRISFFVDWPKKTKTQTGMPVPQ